VRNQIDEPKSISGWFVLLVNLGGSNPRIARLCRKKLREAGWDVRRWHQAERLGGGR
jgi:hypothetical protein